MNTLKVIRLGNPKLRLVSEPVANHEFNSRELQELINSLFSTMERENGIGLAAPQVGINKRIFVFGMNKHPARPEMAPIPYTALINPVIEPLTLDREEEYEACLSIGSLKGKVPRYTRLRYRGFDAKGTLIEREVDGLHARLIQHEYDHLDGVVFLDRVKDYTSLGFHEELMAAEHAKINESSELDCV